eukprot:Sspe_Gene.20886::Locus_7715_Transcript_1_1_Confidence_1.000_Length_2114::g.20886::m.20886/K10415/DYNC1I, DNCI; dynein intermediate chain, cytosolic
MSDRLSEELKKKRERLQAMKDARRNRDLERRGGGAPASPSESDAARVSSPSPNLSDQPRASSMMSSSPSPPKPPSPSVASSEKLLQRVSAVSAQEVRNMRPDLKLVHPEKLKWDLPPTGKVDTYAKLVQTTQQWPIDKDEPTASPAGSPVSSPQRREALLGSRGNMTSMQETRRQEKKEEEDEAEEPEVLSEEAKQRIVSSHEFKDFFRSTSFIVERALNAKDDVMPPGMADSSEAVLVRGQGESLVRLMAFNDAKLTKGCPITSLDFNTHGNTEMFLASYFKQPGEMGSAVDLGDVEGQVLIWSLKVPQRPFQTLTAPADVAKAMYCKYKSNIVIGGLYNGQICLWDTRTSSSDPVQITPLSMDRHTHPVFGMEVVGTVNSHSLVTLSTDGRMCVWHLEKLTSPVETNLLHKMVEMGVSVVTKDIQAISLAFRENDANKFYIGSENGLLLGGSRSSSTLGPDVYEGHTSPITSLHCHPINPGSAEDFSNLVLSSSMDWTCKLWMPNSGTRPIFSFDEHTDYVYDAKWSPVHPAVFAAVDGSGTLSLWHLTDSMETPIGKVEASPNKRALCKVAWAGDGRYIAVGDSGGDVTIWEVSDNIACPKSADWPLLGQKLSEITSVSH